MSLQTHIDNTLQSFNVLSKLVLKQWRICHELITQTSSEDAMRHLDETETIIDSLDLKIREGVINSIVLYAPRTIVLRQMISVFEMTAYLERIGDLLYNVATFINGFDSKGFVFSSYQEILRKQLDTTHWMIQNAIFAYMCTDTRLAAEVIDRDSEVDRRHKLLLQDLPKKLTEQGSDTASAREALELSICSYNLERIGDNATNVAEAAIFMAEGRNVKHPEAGTTIEKDLQ